jgi:hypothetical protein
VTIVWRRLRRKTFAPRRPLLFPEQWGLFLVTLLALALGLWFAARILA